MIKTNKMMKTLILSLTMASMAGNVAVPAMAAEVQMETETASLGEEVSETEEETEISEETEGAEETVVAPETTEETAEAETESADLAKSDRAATYKTETKVSPAEGGTIIRWATAYDDGSMIAGDPITLVANANEGYTFSHWEEDGEVVCENNMYDFPVEKNRTLTAVFVKDAQEAEPSSKADENTNVAGADAVNEKEDAESKREIVLSHDDWGRYYYIDGVKQYGSGVVSVDGSLYYVRGNGVVPCRCEWYISESAANGLVEPGMYFCDDMGQITPLTGIHIENNNTLSYYKDGKKQYGAGVVETEDGNLYYVKGNGQIAMDCTWYVPADKTNGLVKKGNHTFDEQRPHTFHFSRE